MSKRRQSPDPDRRRFLKGASLVGVAAGTFALASEPAAAQRCIGPPPPHIKGPAVWLDLDQEEIDDADEEWSLVAPLIPPAKCRGNKRTVNLREVMNGIMYVLSTGCQWRRPQARGIGTRLQHSLEAEGGCWFSRAPAGRRRSAAGAQPAGSPPDEQATTCREWAASRVFAPAARRSQPGPVSPDGARRPRRAVR
jgi:transposase